MKVKAFYRKPRLELCNVNKKVITMLTDRTQLSAYNIILKKKTNEVEELTFSMPFENKKISYDDCEKLIKFQNEYYVIKEISVNDSNTRVIDIACQHESVELKGVICQPIDIIGAGIQTMYQEVLDSLVGVDISNYAYAGTDIDSSIKRHLQTSDERSFYENILGIAEVFDCRVEFKTDVFGKIKVYFKKESNNKGRYVKKGKDLKQLNLRYNSDEIFTRLLPYGATDKDGVELNILGVNNGKAYIEDYSYYYAKGLTHQEILATPKCLQMAVSRYNDIVDENDLLRIATDELKKYSVPQLSGTINIVDFNIYEGGSFDEPEIGEIIKVIDKDTKFIFTAKIVGVERNFDNPLDTKVEISNLIRYDSTLKNLVHQGDKVDKITDSKGNINDGAIKGAFDNLVAGKADIEDLNATNANIEHLKTVTLEAIKADIRNLTVGKLDVEHLEAINGEFKNLKAENADIKNLLAGNVTSGSTQTIHLTAKNVTIDDAVIKNMIAKEISVEDLKAGNIDTNRMNIVGSNGNLTIKDNTIQIKDGDNITVQIGKDANNDYSMYVWDKQGNLMFDALGIKSDAIKDKIIRNDMISDNANISGKKINISSLITEVNKDTNTESIKGSKVILDTKNQSLEIAFNSLTTSLDEIVSKTESNTTSLNIANGKIETLIKDTVIEENGREIKLKDKYSSLSQTVDGIKTVVSSHSSSITDAESKLTTVEGKQSALEQNLDGFKQTVSNNYTTKNEFIKVDGKVTSLTSKVTNTESSIEQLNNKINLKAEKTEVNETLTQLGNKITSAENKVSGIEIGLGEINSKVQNVENSVISINGNISTLDSKVKSAEEKITPDAIINTVSSTINSAKFDAINSSNGNTTELLKGYTTSIEMNSKIEQKANDILLNVSNTNKLMAKNTVVNGDFTSSTGGAILTGWNRNTISATPSAFSDGSNWCNFYTSNEVGELFAYQDISVEVGKNYDFYCKLARYGSVNQYYCIRLQENIGGVWTTKVELTGQVASERIKPLILNTKHRPTTDKIRIWIGKVAGKKFDIYATDFQLFYNVDFVKSAELKILDEKITTTVSDSKSYTDSKTSVIEQKANSIELRVNDIDDRAGVNLIPNGDFNENKKFWKDEGVSVHNVNFNTDICEYIFAEFYSSNTTSIGGVTNEFTVKPNVVYDFSMKIAQYLSNKNFYRIRIENKNTDGTYSIIKEFTGNTEGNLKSPELLTYRFKTPNNVSVLRLWIGKKAGEFLGIYVMDINLRRNQTGVSATSLKLLDDKIQTKVSSGSQFGTELEQNAYSVRIAWNNISNYVQFENGSLAIYNGSKNLNEKRAVFDEKGTHFWRDGYYLGKIGTNQYNLDNYKKGIVFDLEYLGSYMTWAVKQTDGANTYNMIWTYANKDLDSAYGRGKLHAGCNIDLHGWEIENAKLDNPVIETPIIKMNGKRGITGRFEFSRIRDVKPDGSFLYANNCYMEFQDGILVKQLW